MESSAGYKRRAAPSVLDPSPKLEELDNLVADDVHMLESRLSNLRKRQHVEQYASQLSGTSQPLLKKQKLSHPIYEALYQPPAAFWDNLSKLWLTKRALRELERRNVQAAPSLFPSRRRFHRPLTQHILVELETKSLQSASYFLDHCATKCLNELKQFAKHGGPDLSDLRSVCIAKYLLVSELIIIPVVPRTYRPP